MVMVVKLIHNIIGGLKQQCSTDFCFESREGPAWCRGKLSPQPVLCVRSVELVDMSGDTSPLFSYLSQAPTSFVASGCHVTKCQE